MGGGSAKSMNGLRMIKAVMCGGLALVSLGLGACEDSAYQREVERIQEVVVAEVDESFIYLSDVQRLAVGQDRVTEPADFTPDSEGFEEVLGEVVDQRVLARAARDAGLNRTEEYYRREAIAQERILGNLLVERQLEAAVTEDALRELYDEQLALREPEPQVRGRHLLVESREDAEAARERVEGGEDFADVAAEVSLDTATAASGGELDWFTRKSFETAFTDAAFATEPGNMSLPVETEFGWHVILVEEVREDSPPTYEQLEDELSAFLTYDALEAFMNEKRDAAEVVVLAGPGAEVDAETDGESEGEAEGG